MSVNYRPRPIDTAAVKLDESLDDLIERLAEHNHDVWASRRLAEGWRHGPKRDDGQRTHPDLVPYEELSEVEKEYDRQSVLAVLRATVALGYDIVNRKS